MIVMADWRILISLVSTEPSQAKHLSPFIVLSQTVLNISGNTPAWLKKEFAMQPCSDRGKASRFNDCWVAATVFEDN
ncbi:hypothetical protein OK016_04245 [Vibrio chagasii]|nr:hypothetical protein [Vibrio chagasii]